MPLIPAQPTAPPRVTVSLRLDEELHEQLKAYATFVGGSKDYVIGQMLRRVLKQDREFAAWHEARARETVAPSSDEASPVSSRRAATRVTTASPSPASAPDRT